MAENNAALGPSRRSSLEIWAGATACYYVTAVIAGIGFSAGLILFKPGIAARHAAPDGSTDFFQAVRYFGGQWYAGIADEGYSYDPADRSNVAFFPVYPLLARATAALTGIRTETALLLVSNACFLCALAVLGLYVEQRGPVPRPRMADCAMLAAAVFPAGCFFRLAYTESTFLLLSVLALYALHRQWPIWWTTLIVAVATATRPVGVALVLPLAMHAWSVRRRSAPLWILLGCGGLAAYMLWQWSEFGDAFAFVKTQQFWALRSPAPPWPERLVALLTLEPVFAVYDQGPRPYWRAVDDHGAPWLSLQFANPIFFLGAACLLAVSGWKRWLTRYELALAAPLLIIPYFTRGYEMGMASSARFVSVVAPLYIAASHVMREVAPMYLALLAALLSLFMAMYAALYAGGYMIF
ncbi:MAG: hypothetical protein ACRESR_10365 [Gammaproteobacteria bacterium]